jgi:hypothetical protein
MAIKKISITALLIFIIVNSFAQSSTAYKLVDDYVKSVGSLDSMNMGTISSILTQNFPDKANKARAIFDWIANNVSFDCKAGRNDDNSKTNSDDILKSRKATSFGYAALFQDMCSVASIRCLTVDGFVKNNADDINNKPDEFNHSWDVVQLGQSPSEWYYVDPTWGSGYTDKDIKVYTKDFNDSYFFSNRTVFNQQHFPDNMAWQIGQGPKTLREFYSMPVVKTAASEFGITNTSPAEGHIKAKEGKPTQFNITADNTDSISVVSLVLGDDKKKKTKQVNYSINNGIITFSYKFDDSDSLPVAVLFNGKEVLDFYVEVE